MEMVDQKSPGPYYIGAKLNHQKNIKKMSTKHITSDSDLLVLLFLFLTAGWITI